MATLPDDPAKRKAVPLFSGLVAYFPAALCEVAKVSVAGNAQHNNGSALKWDRSKSGDELDAAMRHILDAGKVDIDGQRHLAKACWRLLAALQKELEGQANAPLPPAAVLGDSPLDRLYRQAERSP